MFQTKGKIFPIVITVIAITMIIYLFVNVEQPLIVCERKVNDNLDITISEVLETTLDNNKIESMILVKTIVLPEKYLKDESYLDSIMFSLEKSYEYLGNDKFSITKKDDRVSVRVEIDNDETIILNNIQFFENDGLQMRINPNTKSSEVLTLKVKDNYSEGEFMIRLKNNGYSCK